MWLQDQPILRKLDAELQHKNNHLKILCKRWTLNWSNPMEKHSLHFLLLKLNMWHLFLWVLFLLCPNKWHQICHPRGSWWCRLRLSSYRSQRMGFSISDQTRTCGRSSWCGFAAVVSGFALKSGPPLLEKHSLKLLFLLDAWQMKWYLPRPPCQLRHPGELCLFGSIDRLSTFMSLCYHSHRCSHWTCDIFTQMHVFPMMLRLIIFVFLHRQVTEREPKGAMPGKAAGADWLKFNVTLYKQSED